LTGQDARWKVSVRVPAEAEEAVTELLRSTFTQSVSSYTDSETGLAVVTAFLQHKPDWSRAARAAFRAELDRIKRCGLEIGAGRTSLCKVHRENWAESWKRHFHPLHIRRVLLIKPTWSKQRPAKGQVCVILDPGLSFGTGHHPTTQFCLEQLVCARRAGAQSCLDIGTGSGILAIAAAKLGFERVDAFDVDPEAVRTAQQNARLNRVIRDIELWQQDITELPRRSATRYSLVCANLISNLLVNEKERIVAKLASNGLLVLAGILHNEFSGVRRAFSNQGLRLVASRTKGEWRSGAFSWAHR